MGEIRPKNCNGFGTFSELFPFFRIIVSNAAHKRDSTPINTQAVHGILTIPSSSVAMRVGSVTTDVGF